MKYAQGKHPNSRNGYKKGNVPLNKGKKQPEELVQRRAAGIKKTRIANGNFFGTGHPNYRDGKAPLRKRMYHTKYFQDWRKAVFERDNYTCQFCQQVGGRLHADHIKPFAYYPELRFELSNGRTLCEPCHKTTPTYGFHTKRERMFLP